MLMLHLIIYTCHTSAQHHVSQQYSWLWRAASCSSTVWPKMTRSSAIPVTPSPAMFTTSFIHIWKISCDTQNPNGNRKKRTFLLDYWRCTCSCSPHRVRCTSSHFVHPAWWRPYDSSYVWSLPVWVFYDECTLWLCSTFAPPNIFEAHHWASFEAHPWASMSMRKHSPTHKVAQQALLQSPPFSPSHSTCHISHFWEG